MTNATTTPSSLQKQYWLFYWPLALTGLAVLSSGQAENAVLARYPNAAYELAVFAIAFSTFGLLNVAMAFLPQTINALGRSPQARRVCLRFTLMVSSSLTILLAFVALVPTGQQLLRNVYNLDDAMLGAALQYLQYFLPLLVINGLRHFTNGLLVQARQTIIFTTLNVIFLSTAIAILVLGFYLGWSAIHTLASAQVFASVLNLVLSALCVWRFYQPVNADNFAPLGYLDAFRFFWPASVNSTMFGLSRPVLYAFVSRMPEAVITIAALRVASDVGLLFQSLVNAFRHFFVTFGFDELREVRIFVLKITTGATLAMLLVPATPIGDMFLGSILGVQGEVLHKVKEVLWIFCAVPATIALRNYVHGFAMVSRRTGGMAVGGICRVIAIYLLAWLCWQQGWLTHYVAGAILLFGFIVETLVMCLATVFWPNSLRRQVWWY